MTKRFTIGLNNFIFTFSLIIVVFFQVFDDFLRSVLLLLRAEERKGTRFWRDFFSSRKTGSRIPYSNPPARKG
jgi:hypothetical protein